MFASISVLLLPCILVTLELLWTPFSAMSMLRIIALKNTVYNVHTHPNVKRPIFSPAWMTPCYYLGFSCCVAHHQTNTIIPILLWKPCSCPCCA